MEGIFLSRGLDCLRGGSSRGVDRKEVFSIVARFGSESGRLSCVRIHTIFSSSKYVKRELRIFVFVPSLLLSKYAKLELRVILITVVPSLLQVNMLKKIWRVCRASRYLAR